MENNKKTQFDEHRSIEIISQMIAQTTADIDRDSGKYFLLWGYTTVIVSLFEYFGYTSGANISTITWFWWLIPLVGGMGTLWLNYQQNHNQERRPKSYVDRSVSAVWRVIGLSYGMIFIAALVYKTNILFLTAVMMSIGTVISGKICQHRVLTVAGKASMILALLFPILHLLIKEYNTTIQNYCIEYIEYVLYSEIIIFAIIFTVMMIIPGHILYNRAKRLRNA